MTPINLNVNQNVSFDGESADALRPNRISRSGTFSLTSNVSVSFNA